MKKAIFLLLIASYYQPLTAQGIAEDSLLNVINTAKEDSAKIDAINAFSFGYYSPDTSFYYARKIVAAGNAMHNTLVTAMGMAKMATSYMRVQDDTRLLEAALTALKMAEPYNNPVVMATIYDVTGAGYRLNLQKDIEYELKAVDIIEHNPPNRFYVIILNNYSELLMKRGQLQEALKYSQRAYEMSLLFGKFEASTFIDRNLADINLTLGNRELAKTYYNLNLAEAQQNHYSKLYYYAYNGLGNYFDHTNQQDSAARYYSLSLQYGKNSTGIGQYIKPSRWLYDYYKTRRENDSAVKYMDLYLLATDSIANLKKVIQVQNIAFEEDLRQQSIRQEKESATLARKHNIQLAMLAIGILCVVILFLLLSRSIIVSHKLVAFLSILLLLVMFEFINLMVHPFLESVTNDSPVLMLLGLVGIAALLVPLHHRLEKWATHKLVEKNKQVRLIAAKRTIKQLEEDGSE
jgi:tetratricopeptide (TPR) repeat protein